MPTDRAHAPHQLVLLLVVALLALYAVPLFFPPLAVRGVPPAPGQPLLERLVPGVPPTWVAARLAALLIGALLTALYATPLLVLPSLGRRRQEPGQVVPPAGAVARAALAVAALQLLSGLVVGSVGKPLQILYAAGFVLPALILVCGGKPDDERRRRRRSDRRTVAAIFAVVALWLAIRLPTAMHDPRAADAVDTWIGLNSLRDMSQVGLNLITWRLFQGVTALHLLPLGGGVLGYLAPLTLTSIQIVHFAWAALCAAAAGWIAARSISRPAAPVVTAALLFSPFMFSFVVPPALMLVGPIFAATLSYWALLIHTRRSAAALAAFGAMAGIGCTHPFLLPISGLMLLVVAWSMVQSPRFPWYATATALLSFLAAVLPSLPDLSMLAQMRDNYTQGLQQWIPLEEILMGQRTYAGADHYLTSGQASRLDIVLGALLAPFAVPRTPMRVIGDALFDPLGTALAACGLAVCVRLARRSWPARLLLGLLVTGYLPGLVSTYDRVSIVRICVITLPIALLTGVGFEALRRCAGNRVRPAVAAAVVSLAIAFGGTLLVDWVTPRLLAYSPLGLTMRATRLGPPLERIAILVHSPDRGAGWLRIKGTAAYAAAQPIPVRDFEGPASLRFENESIPELLIWSQAFEAELGVGRVVCERWPQAALYEVYDPAHLSSVVVARPSGADWVPAVDRAQWTVSTCTSQAPTADS